MLRGSGRRSPEAAAAAAVAASRSGAVAAFVRRTTLGSPIRAGALRWPSRPLGVLSSSGLPSAAATRLLLGRQPAGAPRRMASTSRGRAPQAARPSSAAGRGGRGEAQAAAKARPRTAAGGRRAASAAVEEEDEDDEDDDEVEDAVAEVDGGKGVQRERRYGSMKREPVVALVGLPNCGKSTLFNRLVRQNKSLVTPVPGTTRDRVYAYCDISGRTVMVVDTGGMIGTGDFFSPLIHEQALVAINEADIILFLFDYRTGITRKDVEIARLLRGHAQDKDVILVGNKCDNQDLLLDLDERNKAGATGKPDDFFQLGLGPAIPVSAIHGTGAGELLDKLYDILETKYPIDEDDTITEEENDVGAQQKRISISIVGRPNVGKSSFLNQVLGRDRVIVTNVAGTTLDAVDHNILWRGKKLRKRRKKRKTSPALPAPETTYEQATEATAGDVSPALAHDKRQEEGDDHHHHDDEDDEEGERMDENDLEDEEEDDEEEQKRKAKEAEKPRGVPIRIVDTAGINRRATHVKGLERSSVLWSIKSINRSDIVLLLLDATQGITDQDMRIAEHILDSKATAIVVVNKWDLSREDKDKWERYVQDTLKFMKYVPIVFCSAKSGVNVRETIDLAIRIAQERSHFIKTSALMKLIESANTRHRPPSKNGKHLKIRYATQVKVKVPSFTFFVNDVDLVHFSYQRFLENTIREFHPYTGSPIRLIFKDKERTVIA